MPVVEVKLDADALANAEARQACRRAAAPRNQYDAQDVPDYDAHYGDAYDDYFRDLGDR